MYKLTIKMGYNSRDFFYVGAEAEEVLLVIKSLAEHQAVKVDDDERRAEFSLDWMPFDGTVAEGVCGEEIESRPGWHNLSDE